ncbi:MAG: hypothetical protein ACRDCW_05850, partial [Sarcina sp.]
MLKDNLKIILSLFIKNYLRFINKRIVMINMILFALPLFVISYITKDYKMGFNFISSIYIGCFIFIYFRKVLTGLFIFDDYENYLGFPVSVKIIAISKFTILNFEVATQLGFLFLAYIFDGIIQGQSLLYYVAIMIGYFLINFLLLLLSFLIILVYYKIKNLFVYNKIFEFKEIIENVSKTEKIYKNKKYNKESKIRTLAIMDIRQILRNKKLALGFWFNTILMLGFALITTTLLSNKLPEVSFFTMLIIVVQTSTLGGIFPLIAFSKCAYDQEFILMLPVKQEEYIKSKIIATFLIQLPIFLLVTIVIFITFDINFFYKLISIGIVGINIFACVVLGINYDGCDMQIDMSLDELSYKRFP